jgi:murein DD-endopeptidase MepM/ murein hydrolase activator NlpD
MIMNHLSELLYRHQDTFAKIFPFELNSQSIYNMDLSINNPDLPEIEIEDVGRLSSYIFHRIKENNAVAAVGGYGENRLLYQQSSHFGSGEDARTIHLGIDIWSEAFTPIFAPLPGKVHSFRDNNNFKDYGPTIILEHLLEGVTFYTLYGHLSKDSLYGLYEGKMIEKGVKFAETGDTHENGNWPPHLHFQVITDMAGYSGDFPGVASKKDWPQYKEVCPDPSPLLGL